MNKNIVTKITRVKRTLQLIIENDNMDKKDINTLISYFQFELVGYNECLQDLHIIDIKEWAINEDEIDKAINELKIEYNK